jgi:hypothetical protein
MNELDGPFTDDEKELIKTVCNKITEHTGLGLPCTFLGDVAGIGDIGVDLSVTLGERRSIKRTIDVRAFSVNESFGDGVVVSRDVFLSLISAVESAACAVAERMIRQVRARIEADDMYRELERP